jgi:RND family efflux transporter MFP subunit
MKAIIVKATFIILLIIYTLSLFSCGTKSEQSETTAIEKKPVPVKTSSVVRKQMALPIRAQGVLASAEESKLSFKTGGIVRTIYVKEGQYVRKNQILAQLDLSEVNSRVERARAAFEKADRDLNRMKNLYEEKVVTLETYENAATAYDLAESDLEIAQFNQRFSTILAPADGKILVKYAEENELVNPGTNVFLFASHEVERVVKVGLVDKEIIKLQTGDSAYVRFDALPNQQFPATISQMDHSPDQFSATYEVEVTLTNIPARLLDGFFADVVLFPSSIENYTYLPIEAIVEADKRNAVIYTPAGNGVKRHRISIEKILGDQVATTYSLDGESEVITDGVHNLSQECLIVVVNRPEELIINNN